MSLIQQTAANYLLKALKQQGAEHIFLVPGGVADPFLPEFAEAEVVGIVAAHECGAAYMADGYTRARADTLGVCLGIGGPGVTNMVTGIATAYADQERILVVAGRIPRAWLGRHAFQDSSLSGISDVEIVESITVFAQEIPDPDAIPIFLRQALRAMRTPDRRPAFISVPVLQFDPNQTPPLQPLPGPIDKYEPINLKHEPRLVDRQALERLCRKFVKRYYKKFDREFDVDEEFNQEFVDAPQRVAILAGNGCVHSGATKSLVKFAEKYHIPVATTLRAKGVFPEDHLLSLGVFGVGGTLHATRALLGEGQTIEKPDLLILLGAHLNQNDSFLWANLSPDSPGRLVQVDIDSRVLNLDDYADVSVAADIDTMLALLLEQDTPLQKYLAALQKTLPSRQSWVKKIMPDRTVSRYDQYEDRTSDAVPIHPARAIADLRQVAPRNCLMVPDSGAHTFFVGHHWDSYCPREFFLASTTGPMGWAIPASVGVKKARPDVPCVVVTGDGCMQMHGMELQTAARYQVPILYVVINNGALGNVYLRAVKYCDRSLDPAQCQQMTLTDSRHNWAKFAEALGVKGFRVENPQELKVAYEQGFEMIMHSQSPQPVLIEVMCDRDIAPPNQQQPKGAQLPDHFYALSAYHLAVY